jgi:hypothetical protein
MLIRGNKVVKELTSPPQLPLGLAELDTLPGRVVYAGLPASDDDLPACTEQLESGDRVLLYTDGITDGRAADGSTFGAERLTDFVIRHSNADMPAPEMLRRLTRAISEYQHGRLSDDATIMLVEWMPAPFL